MLPFWNALGVPSTKLPLDVSTSVSYVLPPSVLSAVIGLLAMMPRTRAARVALWPIVALLALRAAVGVDMSLGKPGLRIMNAYFAVSVLQRKNCSKLGAQIYIDFFRPPCLLLPPVPLTWR